VVLNGHYVTKMLRIFNLQILRPLLLLVHLMYVYHVTIGVLTCGNEDLSFAMRTPVIW
jgi:hypothetical protein